MNAHPLLAVLLPAFATGLATTVGAVPFLVLPSVSRRAYDTLLGLGAGLMLAAATLGLLAAALHDVRAGDRVDLPLLGLVLGGFFVGVMLLFLMDQLIPHEHAGGHQQHVHDEEEGHGHGHDHGHGHGRGDGHAHGHEDAAGHEHGHGHGEGDGHGPQRTARAQGLMVVGVMSLHRLPEGFAIGAAWAAGGSALGLTLVIAIAAQNLVEGMVMAAPLRRGGLGGPALLALVTATGMAVPAAALAGFYFSSLAPWALPPMLAVGAGALIYLACNEIIPESHSHGNEVRATFGILSGFVAIILMQALFGHQH